MDDVRLECLKSRHEGGDGDLDWEGNVHCKGVAGGVINVFPVASWCNEARAMESELLAEFISVCLASAERKSV